MPFTKQRRTHTIFMIMAFACLGITTEVFFTAFSDLINGTPLCGKAPAALAGHTYVWMTFIYGIIPLLGLWQHDRIKPRPIWMRLLIYVAIIYAVEFTSGYLLQIFTGACPWLYTSGWNIMGLIRLDYFPAWLVFAFMVEQVYVFLNTRIIK